MREMPRARSLPEAFLKDRGGGAKRKKMRKKQSERNGGKLLRRAREGHELALFPPSSSQLEPTVTNATHCCTDLRKWGNGCGLIALRDFALSPPRE